jgi:integrase/recombinase XerD
MTTAVAKNQNTTQAESFVEQGIYLRNWSPTTVRSYRHALRECPDQLSKATLNEMVVRLRQRGLSPGGINVRVRAINSFLSWLHEEGHLSERLRVKTLRAEPKAIQTFRDTDIKRLIAYRPKGRNQVRAWTLLILMIDCGLRIDEALGLERSNVNLDDLVLRVRGKGSKERLVPISIECRKHLFRWLRNEEAKGRFVFSTSSGLRLAYRNAYRDLRVVVDQVGINGRVHPHAFRHAFAVNYIRRGGDIYRLSRILGHASITTTQLYLRSMGVEHLREHHDSLSVVGGQAAR